MYRVISIRTLIGTGTINALSGTAKELEGTKLKIGNLTMKVDGVILLLNLLRS